MLVSKNAKICITPNAKHKICVTPTQNPKASQWNIGCVGSPTQNMAMYISCCLCSFHLHWLPNGNLVYSGIWTLVFTQPDCQRLSKTIKDSVLYMNITTTLSLKLVVCCEFGLREHITFIFPVCTEPLNKWLDSASVQGCINVY